MKKWYENLLDIYSVEPLMINQVFIGDPFYDRIAPTIEEFNIILDGILNEPNDCPPPRPSY